MRQLLLRRDWQATHHAARAPEGFSLLFPMNDLFEKYVAALMRKALAGSGIEVVDQGGHRACLGAFTGEHLESGDVFRTKPDIILRQSGRLLAIIDTKWKKLATNPLDRKHGVSQADVYQLMAYARLYAHFPLFDWHGILRSSHSAEELRSPLPATSLQPRPILLLWLEQPDGAGMSKRQLAGQRTNDSNGWDWGALLTQSAIWMKVRFRDRPTNAGTTD